VATDARRKEYYWARFDGRGNRLTGPSVDRIESVTCVAAEFGVPLRNGVLPHAIDIAARAERGDRYELSPMYLREADAQPKPPVSL
jgi:tRNA A37 threonylcarbamoyladenosine modification protein TsaB